MRLNGGANRNSTSPGWDEPYSNIVKAAPTSAKTIEMSRASPLTPGNMIDGVATSNATIIARTNAPISCETTALHLQSGRKRYDAAFCSNLIPVLAGLPHFRPNLALIGQNSSSA
jgi:hypothetical protein